jgi:hypothetical protein
MDQSLFRDWIHKEGKSRGLELEFSKDLKPFLLFAATGQNF